MNRHIVVAVVIVSGAGVINAITSKKPLTPVIIGSYIFFFMVAILDMYGGPMSTFAGALAMLAATFILMNEIPWIAIVAWVQGKKNPFFVQAVTQPGQQFTPKGP